MEAMAKMVKVWPEGKEFLVSSSFTRRTGPVKKSACTGRGRAKPYLSAAQMKEPMARPEKAPM